MRRLALAALAFLLLFLPFQAGGAAPSPARSCCPCMGGLGAPACPPACPAPPAACTPAAVTLAAPAEAAEVAPQRAEEPLPLPASRISRDLASLGGPSGRGVPPSTGPPPRRDGQALLGVFRI